MLLVARRVIIGSDTGILVYMILTENASYPEAVLFDTLAIIFLISNSDIIISCSWGHLDVSQS